MIKTVEKLACKRHIVRCDDVCSACNSLHLAIEHHLRIVLGKHIDALAFLKGAHKLNTLSHSSVRGAFTEYVNIFLKADMRLSMLLQIITLMTVMSSMPRSGQTAVPTSVATASSIRHGVPVQHGILHRRNG